MQKVLSLLVTTLLLTGSPAAALRCGSDLVVVGDHRFEVLAKCGEPALIDSWDRKVYVAPYDNRIESRQVVVEEWTYNFGSSRFVKILRFENGRLVHIEEAGYGYD